MEWRPEGWDKIRSIWLEHNFTAGKVRQKTFEGGADAMLKSLEPLIKQIAPSSKLVDILYPKEEGK